MQVQKPHAVPGVRCPLEKADVSEVCHNCALWQPLRVGRPLPTGGVEQHEQWSCTLLHQTFVQRDIVRSLEGMQQALESFRNSAWKESQKNVSDMIDTFKHQGDVNAAVMTKVGDALAGVVRAMDATQLNVISGRIAPEQIEQQKENTQ